MEALIESECTDWQVDFSPDEGDKSQEYFRISRFEPKYGGKSAAKMGATVQSGFPVFEPKYGGKSAVKMCAAIN